MKKTFIGWIAGFLIACWWGYLNAEVDPDPILEGKAAYGTHCARCHGDQGLGDGPDAKRLLVAPRNFSRGAYKFRTTESGTAPSDDDLRYIINFGLPASGMPSFSNLGQSTKDSIIAYIKSIPTEDDGRSIFSMYPPEPLPRVNAKSKPNLAHGKELFETLQCGLCHGGAGRANGQSAATLKDSWGDPLPPADLTQGWQYRAGHSAEQIYYRLMAGLAGTPMPSYKDAVSDEDAWQLANYVVSLQMVPNFSNNLRIKEVGNAANVDSDDAVWEGAHRTDVEMGGYYYQYAHRQPLTVNAVSVQAIYDKDILTFRVFWNDPTESRKNPSDQLVVAFQTPEELGPGRENLRTNYLPSDPEWDLFVWSAQGPEKVERKRATVHEASKWGFEGEILPATAYYEDGQWVLTFSRPAGDKPVRIGFAAWDGENNEKGLKRSASQWINLIYGPTTALAH